MISLIADNAGTHLFGLDPIIGKLALGLGLVLIDTMLFGTLRQRDTLLSALVIALCVAAGCARESPTGQGSKTPSTTPSSPPSAGYCSAAYQSQFGWPDPEKAARVCQCESSGNPRALSRDGKYAGLFQFSEATWNELGGGPVLDPRHNSAQAARLYQLRGWKPWPSCSK